jgi:hypothetical protein
LLAAYALGISDGVLTGNACGKHWQWLGTDVLAELEELEET